MEAKKKSVKASTLGSHEKMSKTRTTQEVDPLVLAMFLKMYMKLLHNKKAVEGLQELIDKCASKEKTPTKQRTARKNCKHKK